MARPSSVDMLPPEALDALREWLKAPGVTQQEATERTNALLVELGLPERVSKSSVNRYSKKMDKVGEKLRQSREVAEMWGTKFGESGGEMGRMVTEVIRHLSFDITTALANHGGVDALNTEEMAGMLEGLKGLSLINQRLGHADKLNAEVEERIRRQATEEAAEAAETESRKLGLSADGAAALRAALEGSG